MNKLRQHIEAKQLRKRFESSPLIDINASLENCASAHLLGQDLYEYRIDARFGTRVVCSTEDIARYETEVRKMICEEIFGEFRPLLYEVKRMLYTNKDPLEIDRAVNRVLDRMFKDE